MEVHSVLTNNNVNDPQANLSTSNSNSINKTMTTIIRSTRVILTIGQRMGKNITHSRVVMLKISLMNFGDNKKNSSKGTRKSNKQGERNTKHMTLKISLRNA